MGTLKSMTPQLLRAMSTVNKYFLQNCFFSSSRTVINTLPKPLIAATAFKPKPVAKSENEMKTKPDGPLTDSFGRHHTYLRISLTERCNLRFSVVRMGFRNQLNMQSFHPASSLFLPAPASSKQTTQRFYSHLTHIDADGKAKMVDVSKKDITNREATARAVIEIGKDITELIHSNNISKGDVLSIAQIAGIIGAKKTAELIPLCHNIFLSSVKVNAVLNKEDHTVVITATVRCSGKTGVEMEALTAVSIAALTVYDMCKAVSHDIVIKDVRLWEKSGGKRYFKWEE